MPIKKSALLLILLSAGAVCLLVYSAQVQPSRYSPAMPSAADGSPCGSESTEAKPISTGEIIPEILWQSKA